MNLLRSSTSVPIRVPPEPHGRGGNPRLSTFPLPALGSGVIRVGATKEIVPLLREFGVDPDEVIWRSGLDPRLFDDENNVIPYTALGHLLTGCAERTHCRHFGLLVGQRGTLSAIGPVGGLMQHSPTVGEALSALIEHLHLHDRGAAPTLNLSGDLAMLGYAIYQPDVESAEQISDGAMAVATNIMRALCGPDWRPDEVLLPRHAPPDPEPYRHFFKAPVRFDQERAALVVPVHWLAHRIAGADPVFREVFAACVRELETVVEANWKESLRRMLRTEILTNRCSAGSVAGRLGLHPRTLHRRLHADGADFQSLVDETRFEIARQLLAQTRIPLGQVSAALGYSEASAFTRAFRRWSGQTPTAWRSRCCAAHAGSGAGPDGGRSACSAEPGQASQVVDGTS